MASTKSCLNFLQSEVGYGQTYSYEILKQAQQRIREIYKETNESSIEEAIMQMEDL